METRPALRSLIVGSLYTLLPEPYSIVTSASKRSGKRTSFIEVLDRAVAVLGLVTPDRSSSVRTKLLDKLGHRSSPLVLPHADALGKVVMVYLSQEVTLERCIAKHGVSRLRTNTITASELEKPS